MLGMAFAAATVCGTALAKTQVESHKTLPKHAVRGMDVCKADIRRFCDAANLKQDCLVAHWSKISAGCQELLATPARNGDGGNN